ncbi:MAG: glycoside hydrolase [Pseudomonadota bacterium]|nr:glycoside hydrolase [Pseudomonadota bacterium]
MNRIEKEPFLLKVPIAILAGGLAFGAGVTVASSQESPFSSSRELKVPAAKGAREPSLSATKDGRVLLSWTEQAGTGFAVRIATGDENGWTEPRTVIEGNDLFVNWADFPSAVALPNGVLAAHWLKQNGDDSYAYDVNVAFSKDDGSTWSEPLVPHRDFTQRQHGFVSLLPVSSDRLMAIWLDGRDYASGGGFANAEESTSDAMALRSVTIGSDGVMSQEIVLDRRTCTCCQTSIAVTGGGTVIVAYRDRSENEIRDISVLRRIDGRWSVPAIVSDDGWRIEGCPVNGPAVAAAGRQVAVAWFSAPADLPRVSVAFSNDEGASFGTPVRVDQGSPAGRVGVVMLRDGSALVSWLELTSMGEELRVCRIMPNAPCAQPLILSISRRGRTSGFPRMVRGGDHIYFAWTQPSETKSSSPDSDMSVQTVVAKLKPNL